MKKTPSGYNASKKDEMVSTPILHTHLPDPLSIIQAFDGLIYISSPDFKLEFLNDRLIEHIGTNAIGDPCYKMLFGRGVACPWCVKKRVLKGETVRLEIKNPRDGRWYRMVHSPLNHLDGRVSNMAMIIDITDRMLAEQEVKIHRDQLEDLVRIRTQSLTRANLKLREEIEERINVEKILREREARLRIIFEGSRDAIFITSKKAKILDVNNAAEELTGYTKDQLKRMTALDLNKSLSMENYRNFFMKIMQGSFSTNEAGISRPDGQSVDTEFSCTRIMFDQESCLHTVARDITLRRKAEQALRNSEVKYRELVENANTSIIRFDTNGYITFFNEFAQQFFGYTEKEILGKHVLNTILPSVDSAGRNLEKNLEKLLKNPGDYPSLEIENICRNGERVWVTWTNRAVTDNTNQVTELLMVGIDNTSRKQAQERIKHLTQQLIRVQESERQKISRDLHDNVAQDLSSLKIGLETLLDDQPDIKSATRQKMDYLTSMLQRSISSVRDLSYDLRPPGLDQLGLVRTIFLYCEEFSQHSGFKIDFNAAGMSNLTIDFDTEINIYRMVQEALRNTQKHAGATEAAIWLVASSPNILLRIKDNGIGFNVNKRRLKSLKERRMGLQSMRERAGLLNGTMKIQSKPGRGTTISIEIPIKDWARDIEKEHSDY
ncbi:MAG: PAS domain S-box protein [Desulfobacteraceae bacterium]|nr:PAS domain S-box protein [Desulfobacteraceae bacterium]